MTIALFVLFEMLLIIHLGKKIHTSVYIFALFHYVQYTFRYDVMSGTHGLKSNQSNHANWPFWQIDLANQPNSYLVSHDLHASLKSD